MLGVTPDNLLSGFAQLAPVTLHFSYDFNVPNFSSLHHHHFQSLSLSLFQVRQPPHSLLSFVRLTQSLEPCIQEALSPIPSMSGAAPFIIHV